MDIRPSSFARGWLAKGLRLLRDDATAFDDPYVADQLGVGRNMAKSIEHWLLATGLAEKPERRGRRPGQPRLMVTEFGETISQHDPWFLDPGTWWFLHINLVRTPAHAGDLALVFQLLRIKQVRTGHGDRTARAA